MTYLRRPARRRAGILVDVASGMVSPVFTGREGELAVLAGAFEAAAEGTPATVLVGAEAGGGKSRLVAEFTARIGDRALVLAGGCVELSAADLPYAPFAAALRELVRGRGATEVAALLPGQRAGELAALLPEFGSPPAADPETARVRLFELFLALLEALADQRPVILVVEDVHWADRPTCDLLSFLVRNLRQAAVLVLVTFRSDSLHHPLRRLLAGLERLAGVTLLDVPRLSRDQVAAQLEGMLGCPTPPAALHQARPGSGGVLAREVDAAHGGGHEIVIPVGHGDGERGVRLARPRVVVPGGEQGPARVERQLGPQRGSPGRPRGRSLTDI